MKFDFGKNVSPGQKETKDVTLTSLKPRDKIASQYADVVELVDSLDLGSNARACRFESCHPHQIIKGRHCLPFIIFIIVTGLDPVPFHLFYQIISV